MEEACTAFVVAMSRPGGKIPLGRPRHRWADIVCSDVGGLGKADETMGVGLVTAVMGWEGPLSK